MRHHRFAKMRFPLKVIATALCFLMAQKTLAADYVNDNCKEEYLKFDDTDVQTGRLGGNGPCYVSIHNSPNFDLKYRDFLLSSDGLFMIFGSFGDGDESATTGAREFFFPTKVKEMTKISVKNGVITVVLTDDITATFSTKTGRLLKITNVSFTQTAMATPANKGGIEFSNSKVPFIDGGFTLGKSPTSVDSGKSYIKRLNKSCQLVNRELFENTATDSILRFKNKEFDDFVAQRCPNI